MNRSRLLTAPAGFLGLAGWIGAGLLHIWTIILAYQAIGFAGAVVTTILPAIAEIICAILRWQNMGFWNGYTPIFIAIVAAFSISGALMRLEERMLLKSKPE